MSILFVGFFLVLLPLTDVVPAASKAESLLTREIPTSRTGDGFLAKRPPVKPPLPIFARDLNIPPRASPTIKSATATTAVEERGITPSTLKLVSRHARALVQSNVTILPDRPKRPSKEAVHSDAEQMDYLAQAQEESTTTKSPTALFDDGDDDIPESLASPEPVDLETLVATSADVTAAQTTMATEVDDVEDDDILNLDARPAVPAAIGIARFFSRVARPSVPTDGATTTTTTTTTTASTANIHEPKRTFSLKCQTCLLGISGSLSVIKPSTIHVCRRATNDLRGKKPAQYILIRVTETLGKQSYSVKLLKLTGEGLRGDCWTNKKGVG